MNHFSGYGAYMLFLALRTHFNSAKYDFFQMHGKLRANKESYIRRTDKHFFEKVAREYDAEELKDFYISNILKDKHYITEMLDDDAKENYTNYKRRRQALSYNFTNEIDRVFKHGLNSPFVIDNHQYPYIISLYLRSSISPETMVILNDFIVYADKFDKYMGGDDPIWSKVALKLRKYKPFVKYDKDKFKRILKEKIDETTRR